VLKVLLTENPKPQSRRVQSQKHKGTEAETRHKTPRLRPSAVRNVGASLAKRSKLTRSLMSACSFGKMSVANAKRVRAMVGHQGTDQSTRCLIGLRLRSLHERRREEEFFASISPPFSGKTNVTRELDSVGPSPFSNADRHRLPPLESPRLAPNRSTINTIIHSSLSSCNTESKHSYNENTHLTSQHC
jgi:hypothetical protein